MDDKYDEAGATCVGESEKAIRVERANGETVWIPQSVVHDESEVWQTGHSGTLVVQAWWAEKQRWL